MSNKAIATVTKKELSLVENNSLNEFQLQQLLKKTPKQFVKERPAKGGGKWDYVTGGYIKKVLNLMFGWDWDFEIIDELIREKEVIVKGRLTCRSNGHTIVKMQYGNKDIAFRKGTNEPLSLGNDLKAASTDALKKCATELGIAADVYSSDEFKEVQVMPDIETPASTNQIMLIESLLYESSLDSKLFQEIQGHMEDPNNMTALQAGEYIKVLKENMPGELEMLQSGKALNVSQMDKAIAERVAMDD